MLGRSLLFCVALVAAWTSHARADFDSLEAEQAGSPSTPPTGPALEPEPEPLHEQPVPADAIQSERAGYGARLFHVELITGVATTVGLLGIAGELNLGNPLSIGAGLGENGMGTDWEAHARWRPAYSVTPSGSFFTGLSLEGAFASSLNTNTNFAIAVDCNPDDIHGGCYDIAVVPQRVYWAQGELGWEGMFRSGLTLRVASGLARELGSPNWRCELRGQTVPCDSLPARTVFVQTFAIGYAF
jgi:hypothetical protein